MRKVIIILVIILVILITVLCYINISKKLETNYELELQEESCINGINNSGLVVDGLTPTKVELDNIFFTVEECIKTYIQNATSNNSQVLYELLDYKYIAENNITMDNVNQLFIGNESNYLNKTVEEYEISRRKL